MPAWFDDFAAAIAAGEPTYLACQACGAGTLPPRQRCPACGSTDLEQAQLSDHGKVLSYTEISVTIPRFRGETPYTVVLVEFDEGVRLTGQLRRADAVGLGDDVTIGVESRDDGPAVITFHPSEG